MPVPTERRLLRYQAAMEKTLRNSAVVLRTNESTDCRIEDGLRADAVPGLPRMMRLRRIKVLLKGIDFDCKNGDTLTITSPSESRLLGHYFVMDDATPRTNARWTETYVLLTTDSRGRSAYPTNETVDIVCSEDESLRVTDLDVLIYPANTEEVQTASSIKYKWAIWVPRGLTYPNTSREVSTGDALEWGELKRPQPLAEKRPLLNPLPATAFYFEATSNATKR